MPDSLPEFQKTSDGSIYGVLDARTSETVTYRPALAWLDGTPMTDAKCFPGLYHKLPDGSYVARVLPGGKINMGWFLVGDGQTDNKPIWDDFNHYINQATSLFRLILYIPSGTYYTGGTIYFYGQRYYIENYGKHTFPAGCTGWVFAGVDNSDYEVDGLGMWMIANGQLASDGRIANNDAGYRAFMALWGFPLEIPVRDGGTLADSFAKPAGTILKSHRPSDYKFHGVICCQPVRIKNYRVEGFSGHGYYLYAPAIQQSDPILAPSRFNTSYTKISGGSLTSNGGYNICVEGADANAVEVIGVDLYTAGIANMGDFSQSGAVVIGGSEQSSQGGYFMMSGGGPRLVGIYSEYDIHIPNLFSGSTQADGHISKPCLGGGHVQQGNRMSAAVINSLACGDLTMGSLFAGVGASMNFSNQPDGDGRINIKFNINKSGNNDRGILELIQAGEGSADGRYFTQTTISLGADIDTSFNEDFKAVSILGKLHANMDGFNPPKGLYRYDDRLYNRKRSKSSNGPNEWKCIASGVYPTTSTHLDLGGPVATLSGSQRIQLASATPLFQMSDVILINGEERAIVSVEYSPTTRSKAATAFSLSAPLSNTTSPVTITFPPARFQATGRGMGTLAQRPVGVDGTTTPQPFKLRPDDAGWDYLLLPNYTLQYWNGTQFI